VADLAAARLLPRLARLGFSPGLRGSAGPFLKPSVEGGLLEFRLFLSTLASNPAKRCSSFATKSNRKRISASLLGMDHTIQL
jgi:hypothetical protein